MNFKTRRQLACLLVISMSAAFASFADGVEDPPSLQPPWWIFQERLNATVGQDEKCVDVYPLQEVKRDQYYLAEVHLTCNDSEKANSLATLLSKIHFFSGVMLNVTVYDNTGSLIDPQPFPSDPFEARKVVHSALQGNPYFIQIDKGSPYFDFFAEFKKAVIQFYADNIGDAYKNINEVAAHAFYKVLGFKDIEEPSIGTTTSQH